MWSALRRIVAYFRRDRLDDDVAEEIRLHLNLRERALIDSGLAPADAYREARRQFGNTTLIREQTRDQWGGSSIDMLIQDVRYGLRMIRKAPGFSVVAIASLAVGIGASTVLFSFANSFLFRPVNAANAEKVMAVFTSDFDGPLYGGSSYADYEAFRAVPVFNGLLAWQRAEATLSSQERPDVIDGVLVSGNYFDVLGLQPSRGRFFGDEENRVPGAHPVVVLSHDAWRRRFGADPAIVGRTIELNGRTFTVVGVGPPRFAGTSVEHAADFFVPVMMHEALSPGTVPARPQAADVQAPRPASGRGHAARGVRRAARAGGGPPPAGSRGVARSQRPGARDHRAPGDGVTVRRRGPRDRHGHLLERNGRCRGAPGDRVRQRGDGPARARDRPGGRRSPSGSRWARRAGASSGSC